MIESLPLLIAMSCASTPPPAAPTASSGEEVRRALKGFLTAFENLDWEPFRASFADDACVFYPSATTPERYCGRAAVEGRFRQVFDEERRDASSGPPYMHLEPQDLQVTMLSDTVGLVSFHLRNAKRTARRTIVFRRDHGDWRIVHLHASNVPWPDERR